MILATKWIPPWYSFNIFYPNTISTFQKLCFLHIFWIVERISNSYLRSYLLLLLQNNRPFKEEKSSILQLRFVNWLYDNNFMSFDIIFFIIFSEKLNIGKRCEKNNSNGSYFVCFRTVDSDQKSYQYNSWVLEFCLWYRVSHGKVNKVSWLCWG